MGAHISKVAPLCGSESIFFQTVHSNVDMDIRCVVRVWLAFEPKRFYHSGFISELERSVCDIMHLLSLNGFVDLLLPIVLSLRMKQTVE